MLLMYLGYIQVLIVTGNVSTRSKLHKHDVRDVTGYRVYSIEPVYRHYDPWQDFRPAKAHPASSSSTSSMATFLPL